MDDRELNHSEENVQDNLIDVSPEEDLSGTQGKGLSDEGAPRDERNFNNKKIPKEGTYEHFFPDLNVGLTDEQVHLRFSQYLYNEVGKKYSKTYLGIVLGNCFTFFNLLAFIVTLALIYSQAPLSQFAFVAIFAVNIIVGIIQEIRAKQKIDKLTILSSPTAKLIRNGQTVTVNTKNIVVDDVILLSPGQQIPTDCILCDGTLEVNESLLTGESVSVRKNKDAKLFAGSFVVSGSCRARVCAVGKATYVNQLTAKAKSYKRPQSEIMKATNLFIGVIAVLMIPTAIGTFYLNHFAPGAVPDLAKDIQTTCAVIIGMIPSGMILLTSATLAVGIVRMSKYNTLVQDMYSLEMLARVDVLCLDKTGTITDGCMHVNGVYTVTTKMGADLPLDSIMGNMLCALQDNNQTFMALKEKFGYSDTLQSIATIPFSSARKYSAVSFRDIGTYVMGAPEFVLKHTTTTLKRELKMFARKGLRVMIVGYSRNFIADNKLPEAISPVAIITLTDNIRSDAAETIKWFSDNGVNVKVISGDNPVTVAEVARRAGVKHAEKYISLDKLSPPEVINAANNYTVFGRVTPEQKALLIKTIKQQGHCVAMTGDGVNDILAMKEADCAVAMAAGSEAARSVSNLVLQDNNFANMPKVVFEGRRVINNVKSTSSLYIMKTLFTAMLAVICIALGNAYPFHTNNLLCFEAFVAGLPSLILSQQPNSDRVEGRYFTYVLCHALPAAITMVFAVMSVYVLSILQFGVLTVEYQAIAVIVFTFSGVLMLYRICQPFNFLRVCIFLISLISCIGFFIFPATVKMIVTDWQSIQLDIPDMILILLVLETCVPVSGWLVKFFEGVERILENKKVE